jgi:uncharacterized protein (TIRG00374 family)
LQYQNKAAALRTGNPDRREDLLEYSMPIADQITEDTAPPPPRFRRLLIFARTAVSILLMGWILWDADFAEVGQAFSRANAGILVGAYLLCFVGYTISVNRWYILLKAQGVRADRIVLLKSFVVGLFFNNLLPSTVGGDISRAYDTTRFGITLAPALAVIVVDRFLGLLALASIALVSIALSWNYHDEILLPYAIVIGMLLCGVVASAFFLDSKRGTFTAFAKLVAKLPASIQRVIRKVDQAFAAFRGRPRDLWLVYGLSLLLQVNVVLNFYLIGQALEIPVGFGTFFLIIPLALFIMLIPISINAVGVREGVFVFLLGLSGVHKGEALALAWISYGFLVLQGLVGGLVYAFRK